MGSRGKKRKIEEEDNENEKERIYRFKILLPDGLTVGLIVRNPESDVQFDDFIMRVRKEYNLVRRIQAPKYKRNLNWNNSGNVYLEDVNDRKFNRKIDFSYFKPHIWHFLKFHDGSPVVADMYENLWDLTPDTGLLTELPETYSFETALSDLIDNSLQAVWSNERHEVKLIRVDITQEKISIFDTGPGMDIVKWGKIGASLHRSSKAKAIGGKPPYLMPYFGMFGYGGPMASMLLGRRALVSSKTKESKKVFTLYLEREYLLKSRADLSWKTSGGIRCPLVEETEESPQGSFTKVEILEPKMKIPDIIQLQCKLKDIYFPYIQYDDLTNEGKTATPIIFQVNGVDLAEIEGGETSITNLHTCNGKQFIFQLHLTADKDAGGVRSPGLKSSLHANAQLKCVYFPIVEGKESIENILSKLEAEGCGNAETFDSFRRVSVRRLGRLLPEAPGTPLPFMDLSQKKGDKAYLLKRCGLRVKCFIETDAGFNPTPSKTDLAHHNPFCAALMNFGRKKHDEKEVKIEIRRGGKLLGPSVFEKEYLDWILQMHNQYDEEVGTGDDEPVLVVSPANKKGLGISSDVVRVHQALKRKGACWKSGQKIKILRGACPGFRKTNVYATIEYFLIEGFQGDAGGEARIICRPLDVADDRGCVLAMNNGTASLDIQDSSSLPISVVDSGKCLAIETAEWNIQLEKHQQNGPSRIELLGAEECQELELDGALPFDATIDAGQVPPSEIMAVVRPVSFISSTCSNSLDQKYIFKSLREMSMDIKFRSEKKDCNVKHIFSKCIAPSSRMGIDGFYVFPVGQKFPSLFQEAGVYTFSFSLVGSGCEECKKSVKVRASSALTTWKLLSDNSSQSCVVRVGSTFPTLTVACFDKYENQIPFVSLPLVTVKLKFSSNVLYQIKNVKTSLSSDKMTFEVKEVLIESTKLGEIRPNYEATLLICPQHDGVPLSISCKVIPGSLDRVVAKPPVEEKELLPGSVVKELLLEMFDNYNNHVATGTEVLLILDGFQLLDPIGSSRKVDDNGCIKLDGLLKVTAGFGKTVSVSILSDGRLVFKNQFQTVKRALRLASEIPEFSIAGSQLENVAFKVVDSEGYIDETIHDDYKSGQSHTLKIMSNTFNSEGILYTFRDGISRVPAIPLPSFEGNYSFTAAHTHFPELSFSFNVPVIPAPNIDCNEVQSPCSNGKQLLLQDSTSLRRAGNSPTSAENLVLSIYNIGKELEVDALKYAERVGMFENELQKLHTDKAECELSLSELQDSMEPQLLSTLTCISTREDILEQIKNMGHSVASTVCFFLGHFSYQTPQKKHFMQDIIGLVALLGTVRSSKLSRILAEYLGEDQMLAVVSSSYEAATALEKYTENGDVDHELGLHAELAALGKSISGRFLVICLEDLRVYREVREYELQRTLALPDPILPCGSKPSGFLGYAVNMIDLDTYHLNIRTSAGHGLRETLLYQLFTELQVYETREHMNKARACITDGAVSLDGGILRGNGILSLGCGNPEICFPVEMGNDEIHLSQEMLEMKSRLEAKERELSEIKSKIECYSKLHEKCKKKYLKTSGRIQSFYSQF